MLRNLETKEVYFVILFSLVPVESLSDNSSETSETKQEESKNAETKAKTNDEDLD